MEIERKWKIDAFPTGYEEAERCILEQSYISTCPVVRIRACRGGTHSPYRLCFKGEGTLVREEIEMDIEPSVYRRLLALCGKKPVIKEFRSYRLPGGEILEVSLVDGGTPTAFMYAEVEFATVEQARAFVPPACLGREMTEDASFSMRDYWLQTRG